MRLRIFEWLGEEFFALESHGNEGDAAEQIRQVFARLEKRFGFTTLPSTIQSVPGSGPATTADGMRLAESATASCQDHRVR